MTEIDKPQSGREDALLESFFQAGRTAPPLPPGDLVARILTDAEAERPGPGRRGALGKLARRLREGFGGWPALAGMATATVAGVWFGFAQPAMIDTLAGGALGLETGVADYGLDDLMPSYDGFDGLSSEG